jgi:hypothetical protein
LSATTWNAGSGESVEDAVLGGAHHVVAGTGQGG